MKSIPKPTALYSAVVLLSIATLGDAVAEGRIKHDRASKLITMADDAGGLVLRLSYDGRCVLDRVVVRGADVLCSTTGVYSAIRVGSAEYTTRSAIPSPKIDLAEDAITVSGIRFGDSGVAVDETWSFTLHSDQITWRITRKYLSGGTIDDSCFPRWDFASASTWTGALLGTGGVAWFKLFDTPLATTPFNMLFHWLG